MLVLMLVLVIDQRFATANPSFGGSEVGSQSSLARFRNS